MKEKKGMMDMAFIVFLVIGITLIGAMLIPFIKTTTNAQAINENVIKTALGGVGQNVSLTHDDLVAGTFTLTGLSAGANYSINNTLGDVIFTTNTSNGTYAGHYEYYDDIYLDSSADRNLMGILVLVLIVGLAYMVLTKFM